MEEKIMTNQKLKTKDIITITLLTLVNVIIFMAGSFLYISPVMILAMPVVFSLLEGIVFYVISIKVPKKGAFLIYCTIRGIMGFYLPYILLYVLAGVIAELVMAKFGYANSKGVCVSYIVTQIFGAIGGTVYPYVIAYKSFFANAEAMAEQGANQNVLAAANMIQSWKCLVLLLAVAIAAFIGSLIAKSILKKHFLEEKGV